MMVRNKAAAATKPPTLSDVARRAGVSTATVSRCLNSPDQVVAPTRERVLEAVDALGYAPNFIARALAARRSGTFGAILPTLENAIFARGLQVFQEELREAGITVLVASSSYCADREAEQIRTLVARGADALLLIGHDRDPAIYRFLEEREVPVIVAWAYDPKAPRLSVGFDNRAAMAELADAVLGQGHRRIAMISAPQEGNDRARGRVEGVRDAMRRAGLDPAELTLVETNYTIEHGKAAFDRLVAHGAPPTAVICGNDVLAVGALQGAEAHGLDVPRDVSVTGFDDIEIATIVRPRLTTVHVPHRRMGREAARALVAMTRGEMPEESVVLSTELRLRETLGPPPAR